MNILSIQKNKNNQVKKANTLIEAKGALSSTAQKMLIMLIKIHLEIEQFMMLIQLIDIHQ